MSLHLLPNLLSEEQDHTLFLPKSIDQVIPSLQGLIAESDRGGRHFLRRFKKHLPIVLLNEHTKDLGFLLEPLLNGETWGLISDAGLPCLADPGSMLVRKAHEKKIPVYTYPGPSSLIYALMLSGLSGQCFTFHGYIAKESEERKRELTIWNREKKMTHIFIEAPYRNLHAFQSCLEALHDETEFCVAWNLTLPSQGIITEKIRFWKKKERPPIDKVPTIFLFR